MSEEHKCNTPIDNLLKILEEDNKFLEDLERKLNQIVDTFYGPSKEPVPNTAQDDEIISGSIYRAIQLAEIIKATTLRLTTLANTIEDGQRTYANKEKL